MEYILYGIGILIVVAIIIVAITSKNKKQTTTEQESGSELIVEGKETQDIPAVQIDVLITTDERLNIEAEAPTQEQVIETVEVKDVTTNISVDSTQQEEITTNELETDAQIVEPTDVAPPVEEITISAVEDIPTEVIVEEKGKTKILFVDDSKVIVVKAKKVFSNYDFDVVTAIDGLDALEKLKTFKPDVIITDIEMPNLDGYGLIKEVRSFSEFNDTPIVMLTSHTHLVGKTHEYGAQGIVLKPFTEEDLIKQINEHTS